VAAQEVKGHVSTLGEGSDAVTVLHVWGTPREMGYAHGRLLKAEIADFYAKITFAMSLGMGVSLEQIDQAWAQMEPFVPQRYLDEMAGLAEGAGVDLQAKLWRSSASRDLMRN
ncbi:MAG: hypothetical protein NTX62_05645, partial [Deltaproteobacteria bacterium]|nr:hypothetical protein [Deltaproteobacteria bacterium]